MILAKLIRLYRAWRNYERSISELSRLDDRELADIGISRAEIPAVAWLRQRLFNSWINALLTLAGLYLVWLIDRYSNHYSESSAEVFHRLMHASDVGVPTPAGNVHTTLDNGTLKRAPKASYHF